MLLDWLFHYLTFTFLHENVHPCTLSTYINAFVIFYLSYNELVNVLYVSFMELFQGLYLSWKKYASHLYPIHIIVVYDPSINETFLLGITNLFGYLLWAFMPLIHSWEEGHIRDIHQFTTPTYCCDIHYHFELTISLLGKLSQYIDYCFPRLYHWHVVHYNHVQCMTCGKRKSWIYFYFFRKKKISSLVEFCIHEEMISLKTLQWL